MVSKINESNAQNFCGSNWISETEFDCIHISIIIRHPWESGKTDDNSQKLLVNIHRV